jgi:TetR/AcrR family transcriptional repressor of nem operon
MRVSKEKAAENRERILKAASRLFRERGLSVGVDEVASAAGMTHGSLYSHFGSKERLAAEALRYALAGSASKYAGVETLADYAARYLSIQHRDRPGAGCAVAALGNEAPRQGSAMRAAFTEGLRRMVQRLSGLARRQRRRGQDDDEALAIAATLIGGIVLARAVDDEELSDRILAACRAHLGAED